MSKDNEQTQIAELEKPKAITIRDTSETTLMNPEVYVQMKVLANDFIASKAVPGCWATASQVLVGLQTGLEMGMKPMEAMNSLYPVNGAINVWGKATTKRLRDHGWSIKYEESDGECTATISKDGETFTETFKFADAELSGYTKNKSGEIKVGWVAGQNRKLKLRYGALNALIKSYVPEVLGSASGIAEIENDVERVRVEATVVEDEDQKKAEIRAKYEEATPEAE